MPFSTVFENTKNRNAHLVVEYFFQGEKINNPLSFFAECPLIFEHFFPDTEDILAAIETNEKFSDTHKLVVSEYGFNMVYL